MITSAEREQAFRKDLAEFLAKHDAELQVTDDGKGYGLHRGVCEISISGQWDSEGTPTAEYAYFQL